VIVFRRKKIYDVVLIGAGPAAVAVLSALPERLHVAAVTGSAARSADGNVKVPKIRSVSYERLEAPGIARFLPFAAPAKTGLFDTAAIGGLANYWGQQFVRYAENDPWPRDVFADHASYRHACARIEALFTFSPSALREDAIVLSHGYIARTPNLIVGTADSPCCDLLAMRQLFLDLVTARNANFIPLAAVAWEKDGGVLRVHLADGATLITERLFLAAGVVGSLRLALASCPDIKAVALQDYTPYMLHAAGMLKAAEIGKKIRLPRLDGVVHFNSLTVERIAQGRVRLFASIYRLSRAPLSLTLAALGLPPILRSVRPPALIDLLTPIQVWTEASRMHYRIGRHEKQAELIAEPDAERDAELKTFRRWLSLQGSILHLSTTRPGQGFHYHAGEVSVDGFSFMPVRPCLEERFSGLVTCLDASILREIGCRPHTLTAMAAAWRLTQKKFQG
jgi:hypothetical protein